MKRETRYHDYYNSSNRGFSFGGRGVCKNCNAIMSDAEPMSSGGLFYHPSGTDCKNDSEHMDMSDHSLEPFTKKSIRRADKRNTKRFYKRKSAKG